jgi:hypothetical protein
MALTFTGAGFGQIVRPGAYSNITVARDNSGTAASGVVMLLGEAATGPSYTEESDITENWVSPSDGAAVIAKYGSGPLVDAFNALTAPGNDPEITGAPTRVYFAKTNTGVKASGLLTRAGFANYGTVQSKIAGASGNQNQVKVTSFSDESAPSLTFTYVPSKDTVSFKLRVNGGAAQTLSVAAETGSDPALTPSFVDKRDGSGGINNLSNVMATGGLTRNTIVSATVTASGNNPVLTVAASDAYLTLSLDTGYSWATLPTVGDTLVIPTEAETTFGVASNNSSPVTALAVGYDTNSGTISVGSTFTTGGGATGEVVGIVGLAAGQTSTTAASGTLLVIDNGGGSFTDNDTFGVGTGTLINGTVSSSSNTNAGFYVVTEVSSLEQKIVARKIRNNTNTALSNPISLAGKVILNSITDVLCYSPVTITNMSGTDRVVTTGLAGQDVTVTLVAGSDDLKIKVVLENNYIFAAKPQVGDLLLIPSGSAIAGTGSANCGYHRITKSENVLGTGTAYIEAERLENGVSVAVATTVFAATPANDMVVLRPAIDGVAKTLEIFDGGAADSLDISSETILKDSLGDDTDYVSTSTTPVIITSDQEYVAQIQSVTNGDSTYEGGSSALEIGYAGTTATCTVSSTTLSTSVSGGSGVNLSLAYTSYPTLSALASYINAQTGYTCSVPPSFASASPTILDNGTFTICGQYVGAKAGRIKNDAKAFYDATVADLSSFEMAAEATAGLPEAQSTFSLSGGSKGATTNANVTGALAALEKVTGNFVVPLFSRDATADIADSLTDASSTYTIDAINAAISTHCNALSTVKRRRNRQGFVSKKGTFKEAKAASNALGNFRLALTFQDQKKQDSLGNLVQYAPWMGAVLAAGMQAAGFYKSITFKGVNTSGVLQAAKVGSTSVPDFEDSSDGNMEDALYNGLLVAEKRSTGGFRWVKDQTTYGVDNNFVFNSIQAVYAMDLVALTVAQRMENGFTGQSLADVSAGTAKAFLSTIMSDMLRLKLIAPSDDAPAGYKNVSIKISGPVMQVSLEIKLATSLYFIPINFLVTQVEQAA